jgi:hypothetical protein
MKNRIAFLILTLLSTILSTANTTPPSKSIAEEQPIKCKTGIYIKTLKPILKKNTLMVNGFFKIMV